MAVNRGGGPREPFGGCDPGRLKPCPRLSLLVPGPLRGYAHGVLCEVMGYMVQHKVGPDEHVAAEMAHTGQRVTHYTTARLIRRPDDPAHTDVLRLVDYEMAAESRFPRRLFAAHIASFAELERSASERERLARMSAETYPGSAEEWRAEADLDKNPGNWLAYEVLGHAVCDQGRIDEGLGYFRDVVERCPAVALEIREIYHRGIASGHLPPADIDPRSAFWSSLNKEALETELASRSRKGWADRGR